MIGVVVTDHALWRYAERVRRSAFGPEIEQMVREGLTEGRVSPQRNGAGLTDGWHHNRLYVWTPEGIVFSLSIDGDSFIVRTTLTPHEPDRRKEGQWPNGSRLPNSSSHSNGG